jgi:hypothetical protein
MTSASAARGNQRPGRLRGALPWIALAVALGAIGGLFLATQKGYRELLDRSNLSVGWTAAAFLSAVTPGSKAATIPDSIPPASCRGLVLSRTRPSFLAGFRYSSAVLLCYLILSA